ncbi:ROK family transcriptional regulator [Streptomyces sp. 6N223]|uniref:ROK family transcriptional regulator n=1 Tax=Streptomyces sp. 6N223 TaxID=3457412 RepID=UPI003FD29500
MRSHDVRRRNTAAFVRALASFGPKPRGELAAMLSVSPGTVTRIAAELSAAGVLQELPSQPSSDVGRRRVPVQLRADGYAALGVHIGLLQTTIGLVGLSGAVIGDPLEVPHTSDCRPGEVLREAARGAARLTGGHPVRVIGTGLCAGGEIADGTTRFHRIDTLGWRDVDVAALADGRLPEPLLADSTHRALARAEMRFGAARGETDFVHLFIGNVIGAGVVLGPGRRRAPGDAPPSQPSPRLADVAHLPLSRSALGTCACGRPACLTSVAGDQAVCDRATREGFPATRTLTRLHRRAREGDRAADYLLRDRARAVGEAVAMLFELLAPSRVFVSGSPLAVPGHLAEIRGEAARRSQVRMDVERVIVPSALNRHARVLSAATAVLERFYDDPVGVLAAARPAPSPSGSGGTA